MVGCNNKVIGEITRGDNTLYDKKREAEKRGLSAVLHKGVLYVKNNNKNLSRSRWVKTTLGSEDLVIGSVADVVY